MTHSRFPERIKIHPFAIPFYTSWSAYLHANKEFRHKNEKRIKEWKRISENVTIYEYIDNVSWPAFPRVVIPQFAAFIKFLHRHGVKLFQTQSGNGFAITGLNYYVVGKLLWNIKQDENEILNDFYQNVFKEAAPAMKRFHERQMSAWAELTAKEGEVSCNKFSSSRILEYLTSEFMNSCRADLNEAAVLAKDKLTKDRVEFFSNGFRYTELSVDAIRKAKALEAKGVSMFPKLEYPRSLFEKVDPVREKKALTERKTVWREQLEKLNHFEAKKLVEEALSAWEKRDIFVEDLKDEFIISYLRIQRNNVRREFNPRKHLEYMQQILLER